MSTVKDEEDKYPHVRSAFDEVPWDWLSLPKTEEDLSCP